MSVEEKEQEKITPVVSLLISVLIRYPEFGKLIFHASQKIIRFVFVLQREISESEFNDFQKKVLNSMQAFFKLRRLDATQLFLTYEVMDGITILTYIRDIHSLSKVEVTLYTSLVNETFPEELVIDITDSFISDDLSFQEELIDALIDKAKEFRQEQDLIGIREEGRVMVFNR